MSRFWEARLGAWNVQILPGELYVTDADEVITTVLGSCVAACVRDPKHGVGGMNHFMLPVPPRADADTGVSARYGLYALESLVNEIMRRGGHRSSLEVKVFGGGRVLEGVSDIGRHNVAFVRSFFRDEHIAIVAEDVGDRFARRVRYWPMSGRVQLLQMPMDHALVAQEQRHVHTLPPWMGSVELF